MINKWVSPLGTIFERNKYEKEKRFLSRAKQGHRQELIQQLNDFKPSFKDYNYVFLKHPLLDANGFHVLTYKHKYKINTPLKMKYINLKMKLVIKK
jgi:hypothetical protein